MVPPTSVQVTGCIGSTTKEGRKFAALMETYNYRIRYVQGLQPSVGQPIIDKAWNDMFQFAAEHPEFKQRLPKERKIVPDHDLGKDIAHALEHYAIAGTYTFL